MEGFRHATRLLFASDELPASTPARSSYSPRNSFSSAFAPFAR
jgi:hypothetical protein